MSNKIVREKAYAKINLSLDVLGKRDDGFHDVRTVMQSVSLYDEIEVRLRDDEAIRVETDSDELEGIDENIVSLAARAFFAAAGIENAGADIRITKNIPIGAGLGGGSADAAAVIRALNRLTKASFSNARMREVAFAVGSDVPFCISGGTVYAGGRGEMLRKLPPIPECHIVICKPDFSNSTAALYGLLDEAENLARPDTEGVVSALEDGCLEEALKGAGNVFERVSFDGAETVEEIKKSLYSYGSLYAGMSGSGSAVFGIFESEKRANAACGCLSISYSGSFAARPVKKYC